MATRSMKRSHKGIDKQLSLCEQRADRRCKSAAVVRLSNVSQGTEIVEGLLLDISARGMRIEAALPFSIGDAVRVDLPGSTVLGEVVHYSRAGTARVEVGLRFG